MISMPLSDIVSTLNGTIRINTHPLACDVHVDAWDTLSSSDVVALTEYALGVGKACPLVRLFVRGEPVRQLKPIPTPHLRAVGVMREPGRLVVRMGHPATCKSCSSVVPAGTASCLVCGASTTAETSRIGLRAQVAQVACDVDDLAAQLAALRRAAAKTRGDLDLLRDAAPVQKMLSPDLWTRSCSICARILIPIVLFAAAWVLVEEILESGLLP